MNACCFSRSAGARSFLRNNMLLQNSYLPCCVVEKSRCHVCRGFACFWVFVCWLTPIPLTVLCVSTCSDGLLDFHIEIPNLRVPRYRLPPVDCFFKLLCHRQSSCQLPVLSYPRLAPILTLPTFATYGVGRIGFC